jgi:hypothetical protein
MVTLWQIIDNWGKTDGRIIVTHSESGLAAIWFNCLFIGRISDDAIFLDGGRQIIYAADPLMFEKLSIAITEFSNGSWKPSMRLPGSWTDLPDFQSLW